mmetsp:Transcript_13188/g.20006  ORF Transcript_13188/g.20006 Transcript_13188/m.20006 type:complete len:295 (+) Transcript_13188:112-996(+)
MVQGCCRACSFAEKKEKKQVLLGGESRKPRVKKRVATAAPVVGGFIAATTKKKQQGIHTNIQNPQTISESMQVHDNSILEEEIDKRRRSWGFLEWCHFNETGCSELRKGSITEYEYTEEQKTRLFKGEHKREEPAMFTIIGHYRYHVYSEEQQERLKVDEDGNVVDEVNEGQEHLPIFERRKHWTAYQTALFNMVGSSEEPAGEIKSWTIRMYTEDQQRRLQLDCFGAFTGINEFPKGKVGEHKVYTSKQQKRLAVDEDGNHVERILTFDDSDTTEEPSCPTTGAQVDSELGCR